MRFYRSLSKFWLTSLVFGLLSIIGNYPQIAQGESELSRFLSGKSYDKDKLLDEVGERDEDSFNSVEENILQFENSAVALILPLDAPGFVGVAANAFLEGFIRAAEHTGAQFSLETYRTDGQPSSSLEAYRQAVNNGSGMVVGPLLRSSVELIARLPINTVIPTILLQEPRNSLHAGQIGTSPLYSFSLGGEVEIMQFANQVNATRDLLAYVLVEDSKLGRRLEKTFSETWRLADNSRAIIHTVTNSESWKYLHGELRKAISVPDVSTKKIDFFGVFAAGSAEFASQARANIPTAVPVYILASSQDELGQSGRNILTLSGIRYYEMPYVIELRNGQSSLVAFEYANDLPVVLQRYVAAGVDAYNLTNSFGTWGVTNNLQYAGATGLVYLNDGRFLREGQLLELSDGVYTDISSTPQFDKK